MSFFIEATSLTIPWEFRALVRSWCFRNSQSRSIIFLRGASLLLFDFSLPHVQGIAEEGHRGGIAVQD